MFCTFLKFECDPARGATTKLITHYIFQEIYCCVKYIFLYSWFLYIL